MNPGPVARETFSRDDRLRKRREFQECYASGVRVSGRHFQLFLLWRPARAECRLGISVARRVGNAVARNRLRRVFREIFRRHRHAISSPADLVVNVKPGASRAPFSELVADYVSTLSRVSGLKRRG